MDATTPDWAKELQESMKKLLISVDENNKNTKEFEKQVGGRIDSINDRVTNLEKAVPEIKEECATSSQKMTEEMERMKKRIRFLENKSKQENLILGNLEEKSEENSTETEGNVLQLFEEKLGLNPRLVRCLRLGKYDDSSDRPRVVKIICDSLKDKELLLASARKLSSTKCWLSEDLSKTTKRIQRTLLKLAKEQYKDEKRILIYENIKIGGRIYILSPDEKSLQLVASKRSEEVSKTTKGSGGDQEGITSSSSQDRDSNQSETTGNN